MAEICRVSLERLATEVRNSIGFFEGQHEQSIHRIFVSGGLARAEMILQTLSDELGLPCEIWDPLETCEVALPAGKRQALPTEIVLSHCRVRSGLRISEILNGQWHFTLTSFTRRFRSNDNGSAIRSRSASSWS